LILADFSKGANTFFQFLGLGISDLDAFIVKMRDSPIFL
jgi:hypothetical protein